MSSDSEAKSDPTTGFLPHEGRPEPKMERATSWSECLKKVFPKSPQIVVWSAVEGQVTKLHRSSLKSKQKKNSKQEILHPKPGFIPLMVWGLLSAAAGIATLIWTPEQIFKDERLKMVPGLPGYELWKNPPDEVLLRMFVFNITNHQAFMDGTDDKLNVEEVGPYVYREKLRHINVKFNDNNTLTYTAVRQAIYLPELNERSLNDTVIVPNLAVLGLASYLYNVNFITKMGFNMILKRFSASPVSTLTVYEYLWNYTDPVIQVARKLAPHLVPEDNVGVLHQIYKDFVDEITVNIGLEKGGRDFFHLDRFRGRPGFGAWRNATCDSVKGSSEGVTYHQEIKRTDVIKYLRKTICKIADLYYTRDEERYGMTAFRFDLINDTFSSPEGTEDCFHTKGYPPLPHGLMDVSPCYYNFPVASSFPHFMHTDPAAWAKITGLKPNPELHDSYAVIEPITGVPFASRARSQSSLVVRNMKGFPSLKRFSEMAVPMFWIEYNQSGLPWYIVALMYFQVIVLPLTQTYFSVFCLGLAVALYSIAAKRIFLRHESRGRYSSLDMTNAPKIVDDC